MITEEQYKNAALSIGCDTASVKAVASVESSGSGFQKDGRPRILFEGHIFWKQLKTLGMDPVALQKGNEDILYPTWNQAVVKPLYAMDQYLRLEKARKINADAANKSASWGTFQIMGFNYAACGYTNVNSYVADQFDEFKQLTCFCNYIKNTHLDVHLIHHDWAGFARAYNGPDYAKNQYDIKLKKAFEKFGGPVI